MGTLVLQLQGSEFCYNRVSLKKDSEVQKGMQPREHLALHPKQRIQLSLTQTPDPREL